MPRAIRHDLFILLFVVALTCAGGALAAEQLAPFASDGCSLFPNGTPSAREKWCDCCLQHDLAYWQGGTEAERLAADAALRDCVLVKTVDAQLAEAMYLGVRAGGHPAFPTWYRWGYGWPYGRGYAPLTAQERTEVDRQRGTAEQLAADYCESAPQPAPSGQARPANWAIPLASKDLKNLYRLDAHVYRSAQPDEAGFAELAALGVTDILNLRDYHDDDGEAKGLPLKLHRVEMEAGSITAAQVLDALRVIRDAKGPVLIHCWHGSDRTGTVAAMYRIVFQNWSKEAALDELKDGGYGYHSIYRNIPEFIEQADVAWYRRELGLGAGQKAGVGQ
jgi:protein tyrosine phosphatase (PTP) superfamily phosphohydrolase (DUF442 family)